MFYTSYNVNVMFLSDTIKFLKLAFVEEKLETNVRFIPYYLSNKEVIYVQPKEIFIIIFLVSAQFISSDLIFYLKLYIYIEREIFVCFK